MNNLKLKEFTIFTPDISGDLKTDTIFCETIYKYEIPILIEWLTEVSKHIKSPEELVVQAKEHKAIKDVLLDIKQLVKNLSKRK